MLKSKPCVEEVSAPVQWAVFSFLFFVFFVFLFAVVLCFASLMLVFVLIFLILASLLFMMVYLDLLKNPRKKTQKTLKKGQKYKNTLSKTKFIGFQWWMSV